MQAHTSKQALQLIKFRYGNIFINHNDIYIGQGIETYGEYSELELNVLRQLLNFFPENAIEVGANIGSHSVGLAQTLGGLNKKLFAFEPQMPIFQQLCANLCVNNLLNANAYPYACANENGYVYLNDIDYTQQNNFGGISVYQNQNKPDMLSTPCIKLDSFEPLQNNNFGLLKIDVEGFELDVLKGAKNLIERCRPAIYLENDRIEKSATLIEYLWETGYYLWWHLPPLFNPDNFNQQAHNLYKNIVSINMLALPKERNDIPNLLTKIENSAEHPLKNY